MAYSAFLNFKGDDVIRAGVDVASSGMYFFAAAATVVGVLFSVPGAQPLAIIFATVGFVLQVVKWFLPKPRHPLARFLQDEVHPDFEYIDMKNCTSSRKRYYDCGNNLAALSKVVGRNLVSSADAFGGSGGRDFDDYKDTGNVSENSSVSKVETWTCNGYGRTGIAITYKKAGNEQVRVSHGCDVNKRDRNLYTLDISDNEFLSSVTLHKIRYNRNDRISGYEFCKQDSSGKESCKSSRGLSRSGNKVTYTNEAIYSFFGDRKQQNGKIVGFYGKSGASIDNLGVYVAVPKTETNRFVNKVTTRDLYVTYSSSENSNMCISDFSVEKFIVGNASGCSKWSVTLKPDSSVNLRMQDTDFCLGIKDEAIEPDKFAKLKGCDGNKKDQNLQMYPTTNGFKIKFNHSELCLRIKPGAKARQVHCGSKEATVFRLSPAG